MNGECFILTINYSLFMKYIILNIIIFFLGNSAFSQISLKSNDFSEIGNNYIVAIVKVPKGKIKIDKFELSYWDFSKYKPTYFDTIRFIHPSKTKYGRWFPESNMVMFYSKTKMFYYHKDKNKLSLIGLIDDYITLKSPLVLHFDDSLTQLKFPSNLDDNYTDTTIKSFLTPYYKVPGADSVRANMKIIEESKFDLYGTIKTPFEQVQVIRELRIIKKNVRGYKKSIFGWTPAPEYSQIKKSILLRWYGKKTGIPFAEVYADAFGNVEYIKYQYDAPLELFFRAKHVNCKGGKNGYVDLIVKGGIPDHKFKWSNGYKSENLERVKAAKYTVKVTDNRNRIKKASFELKQPKDTLILKFDKKNVSCYKGADGQIKAIVSGGVPSYSYLWSIDSTKNKVSKLKPGTYLIRVIDKNYCVIIDSVKISEPKKPLSINFKVNNISCKNGYDGKIKLSVKGGTPPYSYEWSNGTKNKDLINVKTGRYKVVVRDKNNCIISGDAFVKEPDRKLKIVFETQDVNCYGDSTASIKISVSGGKPSYDYLWQDSSDTKYLRNIKSTWYKVKVTDRNTCEISDSVYIKQPNMPIYINAKKNDISCFGFIDGKISLDVKGGNAGYEYVWSNGLSKRKINKLRADTYTVIVTDKKKCVAYDTIEIKSPDRPIRIDYEKVDPKCYKGKDGIIELFVTGGTPTYSYKWSNRNKTAKNINISDGKYSVVVTDKHKCKAEKTIYLIEPKSEIKISVKKTNASCYNLNNGSIAIFVTGGKPPYDYKWDHGPIEENLSNLKAGTYFVNITDMHACKLEHIVEIDEPDSIKIDSQIVNTDLNKNNGSIKVEISGGVAPYKLLWNNNSQKQKLSNLKVGTYAIKVTDSKNCIIRKKFKISAKKNDK